MPLNIQPFQFNYTPIRAAPVQPINNGDWGPPNMAKQLQEGIAGILPALAESYKGVNKQRNMELQGAELMAQKAQQAGATYAQPGQTQTQPTMVDTSVAAKSAPKFTPEIEQIFQQQSQASGIPVEYYKKVAGIESMGQPGIKSPLSSAKGLFQITDETWKGYGSGDPLNALDNTTAMTKLTLDNQQKLRSALGRDPTPGELYLAHQQGYGGAKALLSDPQGNVVDVLSTAYGGDKNKALTAIKNNGGNPNMTSGQFASRWVGDQGMGSTTGAPPTVVSSSVVQPGDTVAAGASAVSGGRLSDPALAYKTRLQEMFPQVKVTSEYRSLAQNQAVNGATGSQHLSGNALDINTAGMTEAQKQAVIQDAVNNGAKGIGWYNPNSMHVDFRQTPAAWGPNKSYSTIGRTPPWFQQIAATLKGGATGNAQLPVQPTAPSVVAAQQPGVVPASGPTRGSTASGQQQPPLFSTPQLEGATAAAGQQPPAQGQAQPPPQPQNPPTQLAGAPPAQQPPPMQGTPLQPGQPAPAPTPMAPGQVAGPGVPSQLPQPPPQGGLTFADVLAVPDLPDTVKAYFATLAQSQGPATPINPRAIIMDPQAPEQAKVLAQNIAENPARPPAPAPAVEPGRVTGTENIQEVLQRQQENQPPAPSVRRATGPGQSRAEVEPPPPVVTNPPPVQPAPADPTQPVNPRQGPAGVQTDPNVVQPPPPAPAQPAPVASRPISSAADPAATGSVSPRVQQQLAQAGVQTPSAVDPMLLRMLGRAYSTGDEGVVQATVGAINALTNARKADEEDWSLQHDARGNWFRYNKRTGATEAVQTPYGSQGPGGDQIINPDEIDRRKELNIPPDGRSWKISYDAQGNRKVDPIAKPDERESKDFEREQGLRKEYETDKQVAKFKEASSVHKQLIASANTGNPVGDISLIYQYMKMLDPNSAVREGEFALAGKTGSLPDNVVQEYNRLLTGERLSDAKRAQYVDQAGRLLESRQGDMQQRADYFTRIAQGNKIKPENVTGGITADYKFQPWSPPIDPATGQRRADAGEKVEPDPNRPGLKMTNPIELDSLREARLLPIGTWIKLPGKNPQQILER